MTSGRLRNVLLYSSMQFTGSKHNENPEKNWDGVEFSNSRAGRREEEPMKVRICNLIQSMTGNEKEEERMVESIVIDMESSGNAEKDLIFAMLEANIHLPGNGIVDNEHASEGFYRILSHKGHPVYSCRLLNE